MTNHNDQVHVRAYQRDDGTKIKEHWREITQVVNI